MKRTGILMVFFIFLCTAIPAAASQYRLAPIPGLPAGSGSSAFRINNSGDILGVYRLPEQELPTSFLLSGAVRTDLSLAIPGLTHPHACQPHAVGDGGEVVGHCWYTVDDVYIEQGFLWRNGSTTGLGFPPGDYRSSASDINASGQIVGASMTRWEDPNWPDAWIYEHHAVLWDAGVPASIGRRYAIAINGATPARIVGAAEGARPAMWSSGAALLLSCPGTYTIGMATDVNDAGQAVGHCYGVGSRGQAAVLWEPDGSAIALVDVEGGYCRADRINNAGTVIGHCGDGYFLWDRDYGLQAIQGLLDDSAAGWSGLVLEDVNEGGTIVGHGEFGGPRSAFVLTPVGDNNGAADTAPPVGGILVRGGAAATRSRVVTLNLSAEDPGGSGLGAMLILESGGGAGAWEPYQTTRTWSLSGGAGEKTVRVRYRDKAGNVSDADPFKVGTQQYKDTIVYDPIPPAGSIIINGGAGTTAGKAVTLRLSAADTGGAGLDSMRFSNGGSWGAWEPYAALKAWDLTGGAGSKVVYVMFRDKAGNVSDADPLKAGPQGYWDTIRYTGK